MFAKYITLLVALIAATAIGQAQTGFTPRDADEAEAWQIYQQYRASRAAEAAAGRAIIQARTDVNQASYSTLGAFGSDPDDRARLIALRKEPKGRTETSG